eukprot:409911-Amphidinium_carterae.1
MAVEVARVDSVQSLKTHIQLKEPCVFRVPHQQRLPFQQLWSREYIMETLGVGAEFSVRQTPSRHFIDPGDSFWNIVRALTVSRVPVQEFFSSRLGSGAVLSGTDMHLYTRARQSQHGLAADLGIGGEALAGLFATKDLNTAGLWISGEGVASMLHYDSSGDDNLNFQVRGSKRVTLFPPDDAKSLVTVRNMGLMPLKFYQAMAKTRAVHAQIALLGEHDILYIPRCWFHLVEHLGSFNVNVSFWLRSSCAPTSGSIWPRSSCRNPWRIARLLLALMISR